MPILVAVGVFFCKRLTTKLVFRDELTVPSSSATLSVVIFINLFAIGLLAAFFVEEG